MSGREKLNDIFNIPVSFLTDAFADKFSLSNEEIDILFDVDEIKRRLVNCLNEAFIAVMRGRIEVFNKYKFGSLLRVLRYSLFMTHRELAKTLKVDSATILNWERMGRRRPYGKMIKKIIKNLP